MFPFCTLDHLERSCLARDGNDGNCLHVWIVWIYFHIIYSLDDCSRMKCALKSRCGFKAFSFSPLLVEMIQFDEHIFQMSWFNHQLGMISHFRRYLERRRQNWTAPGATMPSRVVEDFEESRRMPCCEVPSLKLTASLPLKMDGWKIIFLWGWPIFRGEIAVS